MRMQVEIRSSQVQLYWSHGQQNGYHVIRIQFEMAVLPLYDSICTLAFTGAHWQLNEYVTYFSTHF